MWYSMCLCEGIMFFFKQKTAYEMRISDWSSDVCSSDLHLRDLTERLHHMIFYRRDTDAELFMYLAIGKLVHPVHEKDAARLGRQCVNGLLIKLQKVRRCEVPFLRGGRHGIALFAQRK